MVPKITFPQSEANNPDAGILERLLSGLPKLRHLRGQFRIGGGFSSCRVYIMQAEFSAAAKQPWIVKVGPRAEIQAEADAYLTATGHIGPANLIAKLDARFDDDHGVLLFNYAGYSGRAPKDLAGVLAKPEALEAVKSTVEMIEGWISEPSWHKSNPFQTIRQWLTPKLDGLPTAVRDSAEFKSIHSPDFGEVYTNPAYVLVHDARAREARCPFAFTHGDLNLRNILFDVQDGNQPNTSTPLVIDVRHASDQQYAVVDLAKLEACLRYEHVSAPAA